MSETDGVPKEVRYRAAGGVVAAGDRVLVLRRASRGDVRLPKGHVEDGESDQVAAVREVTEESGFERLVVDGDLGLQIVEFDHDRRHWVRTERYFLMSLADGEVTPTGPGEAHFEPVWLEWADAMDMLTFDAEREWVRRAQSLKASAE